MPEVGGKHFPYTKAGYKAADAAKKRMGHKDYRKGGLFYSHGGTHQPNPAHARWLKRKAQLRNQFPNTPDGKRRLQQAIGKEPPKTK